MKQNFAVWGFAGVTFLVTLGIMSWRNGLWSSDEPGAQSGGATASHSTAAPNPIPNDPFHAAIKPPAAPPPSLSAQPQAQPQPEQQPEPQSQQQPTAETASSPTRVGPPAGPDPIYEQAQDDYKERAKLMEEIAARARSRVQ